MLFNSLDFAFFLPLMFGLYWLLRKQLKLQNFLLLTGSYFFYGWWDWRFLILIIISTLTDYLVGLGMKKGVSAGKRKSLLAVSLIVNLGILSVFKYYGFFVENFVQGFSFLGYSLASPALNLILPVGISFYTFQTLSYTIDIYRKKIQPTQDLLAFSCYVAFFPQLVAGPIERAGHLLPQFFNQRTFQYHAAVDGLRQILWGFFKKVLIADNIALLVHSIYSNPEHHSGWVLLLGTFLFAIQIYCDFSGYSDIAIGTSRLFGFDLRKNFAYPYFSRDIAEFWRRWHISLSTWFRDYLYIPLGGNRLNLLLTIRNIFIVFLLSGLWHGANWTFILWGSVHAVLLILFILFKGKSEKTRMILPDRTLPDFKTLVKILFTFFLVTLTWVLFRAETIGDSFLIYQLMLRDLFEIHAFYSMIGFLQERVGYLFMGSLLFFIAIEWKGRNDLHALEKFGLKEHFTYRWVIYGLIFLLIYFYQAPPVEFIYFQF